MEKPLIVTLQLEDHPKDYFNELRKKYYPPHFNYVEAHLTLFHSLPSNIMEIQKKLELFSKRRYIDLKIAGLLNTGKGVSFIVESPELQTMHGSMQECFREYLTEKDKQLLMPHVTIQNSVTAYRATRLINEISENFRPFFCKGTGLSTYLYDKGPWIHFADHHFNS